MNKIFYLIPISIVLFFAYGIITKKETNPLKKEKRLACHKETITFEKVSNKTSIKEAITLLETSNYIIKSRIEQSKHMESTVLKHIDTNKADKILEKEIQAYIKEEKKSSKKLLIDYYILENDREDPGKKGDKCKLYSGYLVFEFKLDGKLIYKIQTDYMKDDTSDIPERMNCVVKSFMTLK